MQNKQKIVLEQKSVRAAANPKTHNNNNDDDDDDDSFFYRVVLFAEREREHGRKENETRR